ncbi:threonine dehydrogenase-like Zn-dependent dehydrogenase [Isoptericola sp. CG 20/1183]|uniref:Threonine dehydrogenase-like Zn-dependent dehydrogenase n=1 Tax=Isoptericola halotolerans TaxID=300560 RepID=A0ABX5EC50_9MICO|nr:MULTISPECIES: glucose 1-dehydrogenase [Isoptericola]PRZ02668.1 threonine dehydrogenase-like Zn-dependent dehydrogenase [Isoptericola sp. CG 20/1183]PRZ03020.1 threonine dehydrogenase-like Zn-dependent dehydrogenase [Isoptericola halotolerans]
MQALTIRPGRPGSLAVTDVPEPGPELGAILVEGVALGVCGTDREIAAGEHGEAPGGRDRLVLGHESLGRVLEAPEGSGWTAGDLVAGVVRRPDPVPCGACARGRFDMCRNGRFTERGIQGVDGFGSERWRIEPDYAVPVDASLGSLGFLVEPTSVVAKAWEQVELVGQRSWFDPDSVLVTGAGPIGLLAALLGVQRGLDVHVLDQVSDGPKPELVRALGATYHAEPVDEVMATLRPEVVLEATGASSVVVDVLSGTARYGVVCLLGVSPAGRSVRIDAGGVNREFVLENDALIGSVNANQEHFRAAATALAGADHDWLGRLVTRRVPFDRAAEALEPRSGDIKTVIEL